MESTIRRIEEMEAIFERLTAAFAEDPAVMQADVALMEQLERLTAYYESSLWLEDFQKDEKGLLPENLKRGILSEDGIYNFLSGLQEFL